MNIKVLSDSDAVARSGAEMFVAAAKESIVQNGRFTVALSGGGTPKALYGLLASEAGLRDVPWAQCYFFFGDERHVPPDHPDSNYRMAHEALLARLPIDPAQVVRIKGELDSADVAAAEYEKAIRQFFHLSLDQFPRFDLVMLGLGSDGHIASLFPGTRALQERVRLATANWIGQLNASRITITIPVVNEAARVMLIATGTEKARAVNAVLQGPYKPWELPAQLIHPRSGTVTWLIDQSAGAPLAPSRSQLSET